jgi:DNA-binding transcriptional LysR family regulator
MEVIGSLTLDQLRVLVMIDDAGSFSAAARSLGRVQSAISQSVRTLEEIQGVSLFDRTHRSRHGNHLHADTGAGFMA